MPDVYREKRIGKDRTILFDYINDDVVYTWKPRDQAWSLLKDTQDITIVMLQIASLIVNNPESVQIGQEFTFPIVRMGNVRL